MADGGIAFTDLITFERDQHMQYRAQQVSLATNEGEQA